MNIICRKIFKIMRYWFFPESRLVDEATTELGRYDEERAKILEETKDIVSKANQPDVLRNLVIAMQGSHSRRHQ